MNFVAADDPILREVMPPMGLGPDGFAHLKPVVKEMLALMRDGNGTDTGIGMAAPQVGLRLRMFVMDLPRAATVCINPRIVAASRDRKVQAESCLSYPGRSIPVSRARQITAQWTGLDGQLVTKRLVEFTARVFQHELEHLDGVCRVAP